MSIVTDKTLELIRDEIAKRNVRLRDFALLFTNATWDSVQANVRSGFAKDLYPIGTEMVCQYTRNGITYDYPWVVVDNDRKVTLESGATVPGLILQAKYAAPDTIVFDAPEKELATEEVAQPGVVYIGVTGSKSTRISLNIGDPIPYSSYTRIYRNDVSHVMVVDRGLGRWSKSAVRQWLNSDADAGNWWASQHIGDTAPASASTLDGFIKGLDEDFVSVLSPVKVSTVYVDVDQKEYLDETFDKFFLPSVEECYGAPERTDKEGAYWPYWKTIMGVDNPTNSSNNGRKVKSVTAPDGAAVNLWLRSGNVNYPYYAKYNMTGSITNDYPAVVKAVQPACVIC